MTIEQAFKYHFQHMVNYAHTILKDWEESKDVVMAIFEEYVKKKPEIKTTGYLMQGVKFRCLSILRAKKTQNKLKENYTPTELSYIDIDPLFLIGDEVNTLTKTQKDVFISGCIEGAKDKDTSEQLGLAMGTVKSQKSLARKKLKLLMK